MLSAYYYYLYLNVSYVKQAVFKPHQSIFFAFNSLGTRAEIAISVVLDELAHNEPHHLALHCFALQSLNSQYVIPWT